MSYENLSDQEVNRLVAERMGGIEVEHLPKPEQWAHPDGSTLTITELD